MNIKDLIKQRVLIIDGAMGTQIQNADIPDDAWSGTLEGCNELLNSTCKEEIIKIHEGYLKAGADIIKTNTFGALPWVLDDYGIASRAFELAKDGAKIAKAACKKYSIWISLVFVRVRWGLVQNYHLWVI